MSSMPPFLFTYIAGIFGAICIGVGATIYYKRRSELLGAPLALLIGAAGVWSLANSFADISYTHNMIVLWSGVALIGFQFMASFLLNLVTHFVDKTRRLALWQRIAFYGPTIVISLLAFSTLSIKETFVIYDAPAQILIGPIYLVGPIFLYLAFFYSYYRLLRGFRLRDRRTQLQIRYIILGTAFTLLGLTIFDIILPFFGELRFFSVGPVSTIFMVAAFSYTILRHHLIDLRIAMQRGLIYTILLVIIVLIYLGLVFFIGTMLERFTPLTAIISAGLTTALGIFGVPPIARYFRKRGKRKNLPEESCSEGVCRS